MAWLRNKERLEHNQMHNTFRVLPCHLFGANKKIRTKNQLDIFLIRDDFKNFDNNDNTHNDGDNVW